MRKVIGAGGGGGKGGGGGGTAPTEFPDSLQSKAYAQVIDLISEGEIEGLVDGFRSIFFDGTPLQNADGSYNFPGFTIETRNGTQGQDFIGGFPGVENEVAVGVDVKQVQSVTRTITNSSVNAVRLRISFPQLTFLDGGSNLTGTSVQIAIDLQSNGGGFNQVATDTISGKSTSKYERSYRIELTGSAPWDIRVRRITADSANARLQNRSFLESYTEIIDAKLRYPNSALAAIKIDSSQFSEIPSRGYRIKGIKVNVPSNYNPETRIYTGIWDGLFDVAWTDNPAWILYDILTSERYGLGGFIPESQIDKWSLYEIGKYCDALVPDGKGGFEPRFTCNLYLQSREEAFSVVQNIASIFRGMIYWANGTLTVVQDSPADPVALYTRANVVDGVFNYQGSSAKTRHTVAQVTWNDPEDQYRQKVEYVEDISGIARYGIVETQVVAFGCTSQGQANRLGRWLLYSEQAQTETVSFKVGLEGALVRPGDIVSVQDPVRAGSRRGGRVKTATTDQVTVDDSITVDPGTHTFSVVLPNGTIEERSLISSSGGIFVVAGSLSQAPQPGSIWQVASNTIQTQLFKVITVVEADDGSFEVTALAHDPQKFDAVESGYVLEPRSISSLNAIPDAVTGLQITETLYQVGNEVKLKVTFSWNPSPTAASYVVQYQVDNQNVIALPDVSANDVEVLNAEPGSYTVTVYALSALGIRSPASTVTKTVVGKLAPPTNVSGFSLVPSGGYAYLSWERSTDLDVLIGGSVRIRWAPNTVDPVWKDSVDIMPALPGTATRAQAPLLGGSYMAKFVDSSGVGSLSEALIITTVPEPLALNVVQTITEDPTFSGTKTNMEVSGFYGGLILSAETLVDDLTDNVDDLLIWDFAGGVSSSGTYDFATVVDLSEVYASGITASIQASAVDVADTIDQREDLCDDWLDLDGNFIDNVNAELFLSTTDDDPASMGATWSPYKRFFAAEYTARGIKFRLISTSGSPRHNIAVSALSVVIDMPDRVVPFTGLVSGAGTYAVTYPQPFKVAPSVGITGNNLNSGDYFEIANKTRSGFDITFRNSGGTAVSRTFDVIARGYGREV